MVVIDCYDHIILFILSQERSQECSQERSRENVPLRNSLNCATVSGNRQVFKIVLSKVSNILCFAWRKYERDS